MPAVDASGALLGASPGASTAVPIMIELLQKTFPKNFKCWQSKLKEMVPGYGVKLDEDPELAVDLEQATPRSLQLEVQHSHRNSHPRTGVPA